ncbi:lysozyme inhibitor LprI family protein [Methylocystis sp. S23]|jgi:uncharacterized protein YecT (DUF1311 family)
MSEAETTRRLRQKQVGKISKGDRDETHRRLLAAVPAAARDKLRDAQRAWIAYRAARCEVESALHPAPLGEDNRADRLMEETARRALQLRAIAIDSY